MGKAATCGTNIPKWVLIQILAAPLLTHLPDNVPGKAADGVFQILGLMHTRWRLSRTFGSCFQTSSVLPVVAICKVNQ